MIDIITDFVKEWLKNIVVLFLIISLVDLVMPKGKMKIYVDFIIGILIIFTVISPFTKLNNISLDLDREVSNFTDSEISGKSLSSIQENQIEEIYLSNINQELIKIIEENSDYRVEDIKIDTLPDEANIFSIDEIKIVLSSKTDNENESSSIKVNKIKINNSWLPVMNDGSTTEIVDLVTKYIEIDRERVVISLDKKGD